MYVQESMVAAEIAARLGCGVGTVLRRLRALGIARRPRGPRPASRHSGSDQRAVWSPDMAWVVGLIATDGNLANARNGISITSKDLELLESARRCLGLTNRLVRVRGGWGTSGHRLQWRDRTVYAWLLTIGLMPRKSLRLGPLAVPDEVFADFFRGCIDGDGTVLVYTDRHHMRRKASYVYTRLYVSLVSASRPFLDWIRATVHRLVGLPGRVHAKKAPRGRTIWCLRYSKRASLRLLGWMYYSPTVPCLARKRAKAEPFILRPE
jgi:hypothetical protein